MRALRGLLGVLIPLVVAVALFLWLRAPDTRPNILLVTVDTLRADHLGIYGYERPTSPNIDALAASSAVFDSAYTHATLSGPSHATMMTSLYPPVHGVTGNAVWLEESKLTLADILRSSGYDTAFFASHPLVGGFGFDQGFDTTELYTVFSHGPDHAHADDVDPQERLPLAAVFEAAHAWLAAPKIRPYFLWLHVQHVHKSYEPPAPYDTKFTGGREVPGFLRCMHVLEEYQIGAREIAASEREQVVALYDGEIAFVDEWLGKLFELADENTIVALTADHGEMLFDDREQRLSGHGRFRYDPVLRVPLIIRGPGPGASRRVPGTVGLIDLAPTLLELAGVRIPGSFEGTSLVSRMRGDDTSVRPHSYSITFHTDDLMRIAVRSDRHKLICDREPADVSCELYDLQNDPREYRNLTGDPAHAEASGAMLATMERWFVEVMARAVSTRLEPRTEEALKLLRRAGYLRDEGSEQGESD